MKLPVVSGREVVKALGRAGFDVVRQRGSHVKMRKVIAERPITLTVPLRDPLKRGTLHGILKEAGLSVEEFQEML